MNRPKSWLSQLAPIHQPFPLRSYQGLAALFLLGLLIIATAFYVLNDLKTDEVSGLEARKQELEDFILSNMEHETRLKMPEVPSGAEALSYAQKVPLKREVPRFLHDLEVIADENEIQFSKLEVKEVQPDSHDLVTSFLTELGTLAKELKDANQQDPQKHQSENQQSGKERVFVESPEKLLERFIVQSEEGKLDSEAAKQDQLNPELLEYIPFGIIQFHAEFDASYRQLRDFLDGLSQLDRLVHVEKWEYAYDEKSLNSINHKVFLDFRIFYYKKELQYIPPLPPLELERTNKEPIIAVPKAWLQETEKTERGTGTKEAEGSVSSAAEAKQESAAIPFVSEPPEPETKD